MAKGRFLVFLTGMVGCASPVHVRDVVAGKISLPVAHRSTHGTPGRYVAHVTGEKILWTNHLTGREHSLVFDDASPYPIRSKLVFHGAIGLSVVRLVPLADENGDYQFLLNLTVVYTKDQDGGRVMSAFPPLKLDLISAGGHWLHHGVLYACPTCARSGPAETGLNVKGAIAYPASGASPGRTCEMLGTPLVLLTKQPDGLFSVAARARLGAQVLFPPALDQIEFVRDYTIAEDSDRLLTFRAGTVLRFQSSDLGLCEERFASRLCPFRCMSCIPNP